MSRNLPICYVCALTFVFFFFFFFFHHVLCLYATLWVMTFVGKLKKKTSEHHHGKERQKVGLENYIHSLPCKKLTTFVQHYRRIHL